MQTHYLWTELNKLLCKPDHSVLPVRVFSHKPQHVSFNLARKYVHKNKNIEWSKDERK